MKKYLLNHKFILFVVICTFFLSIQPSKGMALPSESVSVLDREVAREAQIEKIMFVLDRPEAQAHLMVMGINKSQVRKQLSQLDDSQLALVSERADTVKAAGNGAAAVLIVLLIVLLVVMIFYFGSHHGHHHL